MSDGLVVLTRGVPGSGKTTWAKKLHSQYPDETVLVSRDDIRAMLNVDYTFTRLKEHIISEVELGCVLSTLDVGLIPIVHDTFVSEKYLQAFHDELKEFRDTTVIVAEMDTPDWLSIQRNSRREKPVPLHVVESFIEKKKTPLSEYILNEYRFLSSPEAEKAINQYIKDVRK